MQTPYMHIDIIRNTLRETTQVYLASHLVESRSVLGKEFAAPRTALMLRTKLMIGLLEFRTTASGIPKSAAPLENTTISHALYQSARICGALVP